MPYKDPEIKRAYARKKQQEYRERKYKKGLTARGNPKPKWMLDYERIDKLCNDNLNSQ